MMTGFLKRVSGEWVYADPEGALVGGWVRDGVYGGPYWYYLDPATKVMRTGWLFERGSWYYLGVSGNMHTGWITYGQLLVLPELNWSDAHWMVQPEGHLVLSGVRWGDADRCAKDQWARLYF